VTRIFDNIKDELGEHLQKTLLEFDRVDVAVGYFNLRGWRLFDQSVREKARGTEPTARILIGMVFTGPQEEALAELQSVVDGIPLPEADAAIARERKAEFLDQVRSQLMRGLPTASDRLTLRSLRSLLETGAVEIKVFTRRPLHGKTYIFHRVDWNNPITGF